MSNYFSKKIPTVDFTVKNVSPQQKTIKIFGLSIPYLKSANLMAIPEVTEADIKASITKGELGSKIRAQDIQILSTTINLLDFDSNFRDFIDSVNVNPGDPIPGTDPYTQVGSGGGGTVIDDEGTLSGTYDGDVLCKGDVTLTDATIINGNLVVLGELINHGKFSLYVVGDLHAQSIDFVPDDITTPQSNFEVGGNLTFITNLTFPQCGGSAAELVVHGNLIGAIGFIGSYLNGYGLDDNPGLQVRVYGDMSVGHVDLFGGDSNAGNAGIGGTIIVYGDLNVAYSLRVAGGDSSNIGFNAGNGGFVTVYGNLVMGDDSFKVDFSGGDAVGATAGDGGNLIVSGNCVLTNHDDNVVFMGGNCTSDDETHKAGFGGNITVYGDFVCDTDLDMYGGDRDGTLSIGANTSTPDGGNISVDGNAFINDINCAGGVIGTTNFSPCNGGNGGIITVKGNLVVNNQINLVGGQSAYSFGGNGGNINVRGNFNCEDNILINGEDGGVKGGNGGNIDIRGNMVVNSYVDMYGGLGNAGNGGNGGNLYIDGHLVCQDIYADGGNCDSTNETHRAGAGGSIYINGGIVTQDSSIYLDAGERSGATTVANTGVPASPPGQLYCSGDCYAYLISGSGCNIDTDYPQAAGTNGSTIEIMGDLYVTNIEIEGGNSRGNNAGRGGFIYVDGKLKVKNNLVAVGGDSLDSVGVGSDAATNGAGPTIVRAKGGMDIKSLNMHDGNGSPGSTAPTNIVDLLLEGNNTIYQIDISDRPEVHIKPNSNQQCTLKIGDMLDKTTLNDTSDTASSDISADLLDTFYISDGIIWYAIAGTSIF